MMKKETVTRRDFIKLGTGIAATGLAAKVTVLEPLHLAAAPRPIPPSDTVRFGVIGTGTEGCDLLKSSLSVPGIECVAVSDLYTSRLIGAKEILNGKDIETTREYRRLLDRKDIDAILCATPDHWHRRVVEEACQAGKDVYVEKPMSHSVEDGKAMVAAVNKYNRILEVGSQRASSILYLKAKEIWDSGKLGMVDTIEAVQDRNADSGAWVYPVPPDAGTQTIDWDTWLGRAPKIPFDPVRFFRWRCYKDYGTGMGGDLIVHLLTGIHTVTGINQPPQSAYSSGGIYYYKDGREYPDLIWTMYDYPDLKVVTRCHQNNNKLGPNVFGFYGKNGTMTISGLRSSGTTLTFTPQASCHQPEGYSTKSWPKKLRDEYLANWQREHPEPGPGQGKLNEDSEVYTIPPDYNDWVDHLSNFFNAIRTRKHVLEDEVFGSNTSIGCHMSNASYFLKRPVTWDEAAKEIRS